MLVRSFLYNYFFFNDTATTEIYTLSLHDALPISMDDAVRRVAGEADLLLFDGTFWSDRELGAAAGGADTPTAREMGHLPVGGPGGSLELLPGLDAKRVVLVHINNTNPILCRTSAERAQVAAAGIVVGEDAMEFELNEHH